MTSKKVVLKKMEKFLEKKGSVSYRVCKLLEDGNFNTLLSSQELSHMINEGPGKKIKVSNLAAFLEPLLNEDIIKIKIIGKGGNKRKYWFPAWLDKKDIEKKMAKGLFNIQLPKKVLDNIPQDIRESIIEDMDEVNRCITVEAWKSVCILCGRITESILLNYIISFDKKYPGNTNVRKILGAISRKQQITYDFLKSTAQEIKLIKDNDMTENFFDLVISCRHSSVHFRGGKLNLNDKKTAALAKSTEIIFEDVFKNAKSLAIV